MFRRPPTGPRVWVAGLKQVDDITQEVLTELASKYTIPRPPRSFKDPPQVKQAFKDARVSRSKESWKRALLLRRGARRKWEADRICRASQCDWAAFRDVKQSGQGSWDIHFAEHQSRDPHRVVEEHFAKIYEGEALEPQVVCDVECEAFTVEEVQEAVYKMKGGKSVGLDLTSRELFQGLLQVDGGAAHLAEFFTRVLSRGVAPVDWTKSIMIVLAKTPLPVVPKELRPIVLGSSASKLYSRLVLNRTLKYLGAKGPSQCSHKYRQTCDYVFTLWRVFELCREWGRPLVCVKVDVAKAFDSLDRRVLLQKLRARLGDTPEMRAWENLLLHTEATLLTPWGMSTFVMRSGIRQGAVESPCFFSVVMEEAVIEAAEKYKWSDMDLVFSDQPCEHALFMDDGVFWTCSLEVAKVRIAQLTEVLRTYGLKVNLEKCQLYCSQDVKGLHKLVVQGVELKASEHLDVMGLKLRKGMSCCELLQPLVARAKAKFWENRHLLRCKTSLKGRLALLQRVVAGAGLWCVASVPPDKAAMGLLNSVQATLISWMCRFYKGEQEQWDTFKQRVVRDSRAILHKHGFLRWSTLWMQRWWDYAGHTTRGGALDTPAISSLLINFRDLTWWRHQQGLSNGVKHAGRHFARLTQLEEQMNRVCKGPWRQTAKDRAIWAGLKHQWVREFDTPWASGRQLALQ